MKAADYCVILALLAVVFGFLIGSDESRTTSKKPEPFKITASPVYESDIIEEANRTGRCWANMICDGTRDQPNLECRFCEIAFKGGAK